MSGKKNCGINHHETPADPVYMERFKRTREENGITLDNVDAPGGPCIILITGMTVPGQGHPRATFSWAAVERSDDRNSYRSVTTGQAAWVTDNNEPIPPGGQIHHKCGNGGCVNGNHLMMFETAAEHRAWHKAHPLEALAYDGGITNAVNDEAGPEPDSCTA